MKDATALLYHPISLGIEAGFFESLLKKSVREGEEKLMLAVLEDAVACFQKYVVAKDARGKTLFREAEDWILEENSDWIFSFESICEVLGLSPAYVRQGLMQWKESMLAAAPKAKVYRLTPRRKKRKTSADKTGPYLSDVKLVIEGAEGSEVVNTTTNGPWFYIRLPEGTYSVKASFRGKTKEMRALTLQKDKPIRRTLLWNAGEETLTR